MSDLDFQKIFASGATSQIDWTDENYLQGWGYLGQVPPSYQAFDYLQRQNDLKLKYLYDEYANIDTNTENLIASAIETHDDNEDAHEAAFTQHNNDENAHQILMNTIRELIENSGINILKRNKAYNVGDIAYSTKITSTTHLASKLYLECIEAGTSRATEPTLTNVNLNDEITDGTAKFKVYDVGLQSRPVGNIYQSTNATSPAELFGGTWEEMPAGRVLLAQGQSDWGTNYAAGSTGGEATHQLTVGEMPSHGHAGSTNLTGNHTHSISFYQWEGSSNNPSRWSSSGDPSARSTSSSGSHSHSVTINNTGNNQSHNNMQPYLSCYIWKRTA